MPFVSIFERKAAEKAEEQGLQRGRREELPAGLEITLDVKYSAAGMALFHELVDVEDLAKLKRIQQAIRGSASIEELRKLL